MLKRTLVLLLMSTLILGFCQAAAEEAPATPTDLAAPEILPWDCPGCGTAGNTGSFCTECGAPAPWDCPDCGTAGNTGNFCPNCGAARPNGEEPAEPTEVQIGDTITFGKWEQDNDARNGDEPIEWTVLDLQGGRALVISRFGLIQAKYMNSANGQVWANSTLRGTLNYEFFNAAFTDEEKAAIAITHLEENEDQWDPDRPAYNRLGTDDTNDRIFALSYAEAKRYFPTDEARKCYCSEYIRHHANRSDRLYAEGRTCWYWLRTPAYANNASIVDWDGSFESCYMHHAYGVARPACWVNLSALGLSAAGSGTGDEGSDAAEDATKAAADETAPSFIFGDLVTFGHYEQDNDPANGAEPIEWRVLEADEENGLVLLIARYGLDHQPFHTGNRTTWEECSLRAWLNDAFLNTAFTPEEREAIALTEVDNSGSQNLPAFRFDTNNTQDKVFLLSYAEAMRFMGTEVSRLCAPTAYAIAAGAYEANDDRFVVDGQEATRWWLRSPGRGRSYAMYAGVNGRVDDHQIIYLNQYGIAVRPAIWVSLDALRNGSR